jgi:hypothetical protein
MLAWSESDPAFTIDEKMIADFERRTSEAAFESKISALLLRAHRKDVAVAPSIAATYQEAREVLATGDHYLSVIFDASIGVSSRRGYGASLYLAFQHSIVIVGAGTIALIYADRTNASSRRLHAGSALVFLATLISVFVARLSGASTLREAWSDRPGTIGGVVPVAVITAGLATIVAVVLFGLRR